jgi:hypothetical protein
MENLINLEVKIMKFVPNAMHDQMDNGGFANYDASEVIVILPNHMKNEKLIIFHPLHNDLSEKWKDVGRIIKFKIAEFLIIQGYNILSTGLREIEFPQYTND